MRPGEENSHEDRAGGASSSQIPTQAEGTGEKGFDDSNQTSEAEKRELMGSSSDQTTALGEKRQVGVPLDEVLKGLIVCQMRAPFVHVEGGLVNLIKVCVTGEQPFFSRAALSGYVDHFQSVHDEDLGWGCGWRNIQILCSFLLTENQQSREVLFNGAGFVPDIPALQLWLEIAWSKGFDEPGAKYFNWSISGTRDWIGTTECAALLRSFGIRAKIVSFTALGGKRGRSDMEQKVGQATDLSDVQGNETSEVFSEGVKKCPGQLEFSNSRGGALSCDECGKICQQGTRYRGIVDNDCNLCDDCMKVASDNHDVNDGNDVRLDPANPDTNAQRHIDSPKRDMEHPWNFGCDRCGEQLTGRRYKSRTKINFDLCSECMKYIEENPTDSGSTDDFIIIEEFPAFRCSGPPVEDEYGKDYSSILHKNSEKDQEEKSDANKEGAFGFRVESKEGMDEKFDDGQRARERGGRNLHEDIGNEKYQKAPNLDALTSGAEQNPPENSVGHNPIANDERRKAGMRGTASEVKSNDIDHHHLIEWVWSYFTQDSSQRFSASSRNARGFLAMSKRSPLYFQHRGHSRTIVGIERRRKPDGISEDVYLFVLDPSLSTDLLVKSLKDNSGWQKLIMNDVHTLKEAEYQLCYVDPGIATGEELEQLKVLSSLRYSYY